MIGFFFGAAAALIAVKYFRHGGFGWRRFGHGRGWGRRWILRNLYERLETTPGQERIIEGAVDQVLESAARFRDERHRLRSDVASALKGERFDSAPLTEMFARQDAVLAQLRKTLTEGLAKVHETLDPRQRGVLGEALQYGDLWGGRCGHHRHGGFRSGGHERYARTV